MRQGYFSHVRESGFTLVEIMVVVAVLALVGTGFLVEAISARNATNLEVGKNLLVSILTNTEALGRGGLTTSDTTSNARFDRGYGVYIASSSATDVTKIIQYEGMGNGETKDERRYNGTAKETSLFPDGVSVRALQYTSDGTNWSTVPSPFQLSIHFKRGSKGVMILKNSDNVEYLGAKITVQVLVGGVTMTRDVVVWNTGLIYAE